MATGASNSDLAVILIDARKGVLTQTRRHAYHRLAARHPPRRAGGQQDRPRRLRPRSVFDDIVARLRRLSPRSSASRRIVADPDLGALRRQCHRAERRTRPGITGPTLLEHLETRRRRDRARGEAVPLAGAVGEPAQSRFPRLLPARSPAAASRPGDDVVVAKSGQTLAGRAHRHAWTATSTEAVAGEAVTLTLADEVDISRGDVLAPPDARPEVSDQFAAHLLWMAEDELLPGRQYLLKIGAATVPAHGHRAQAQDRRQHARASRRPRRWS